MSTLREILERIWSDTKVRCPKHVVWWHDNESTVSESGRPISFNLEDEGLFWRKGKPIAPDKPKQGLEHR
jgi:hypothetical protein